MQKQRRAVSCKDAIRHRQVVLSGATDLKPLERAQSYSQGRPIHDRGHLTTSRVGNSQAPVEEWPIMAWAISSQHAQHQAPWWELTSVRRGGLSP